MKAFFIFFISLFIFDNSKAQQKYDSVYIYGAYNEALIRICENGRYGAVNKKGKLIIKPIYDTIFEFGQFGEDMENLALVIKNNKKGFIDPNGKQVVKPIYDDITVRQDELIVTKNKDKYGLLSNRGKVIFNPIFDSIYHYPEQETENLIRISMNSKFGYIYDGLGYIRILIPAKYDSIGIFNYLGLALVKVNGKYGYIGGKEIVKPIYDTVFTLYDDDGLIYIKKDNKWGILDYKGKSVISLTKDSLVAYKTKIYDWVKFKSHTKYGVINNQGKIIAKPIYDKIYPFSQVKSGFAEAELNGKKGFIDSTGKYFPNQ